MYFRCLLAVILYSLVESSKLSHMPAQAFLQGGTPEVDPNRNDGEVFLQGSTPEVDPNRDDGEVFLQGSTPEVDPNRDDGTVFLQNIAEVGPNRN